MRGSLLGANLRRRRVAINAVASICGSLATKISPCVRRSIRFGLRDARCDTPNGGIVYFSRGNQTVYYFNTDKT